MRKKMFNKYTIVWLATIVTLLLLIWQMFGDARVINYSSMVRGVPQKIVKEELNGNPNDALIAEIDGIIYDLQTGKGEYDLVKFRDAKFHEELDEVDYIWKEIKAYVYAYRVDESLGPKLYWLSEIHYRQADEMVARAEQRSSQKFFEFLFFYFGSMALLGIGFIAWEKLHRDKINEIMIKDSLTGAYTLYAFQPEVKKLLQKNNNEKFLLIALDIRNFKKVNAFYGYETGDRILALVAQSLIAQNILVSRVSLDDYFVCMPYAENASEILDKIFFAAFKKADLENRLVLDNLVFRYGICPMDEKFGSLKSIMEKASIAHKLAKLENKAVVWCDDKLMERLGKEAYFDEHLSKALANKEFKLYLQPQVDLKTNKIVSAESLVRWKLETGKMLFPDEFIPIFEQKGLIKQLDYYMLEEVCLYLSAMKSANKELYTISVNFSRVTLADNDFCKKIMNIVNAYQIPYNYIGIEVLETALNDMDNNTIYLLETLKTAGFEVAIDDFGAGYSSLSAISNLPVNVIKLDKDFLWSIDENEKMRHIITLVVNMSHYIGLKVLCEGVETKQHVDFLQEIGCDFAQGYYYSKPIPKEIYHELL